MSKSDRCVITGSYSQLVRELFAMQTQRRQYFDTTIFDYLALALKAK